MAYTLTNTRYASVAQFKLWADQNDVTLDALAGATGHFDFLLGAAADMIDERGYWWDARTASIKTHGAPGSAMLWMPADIVSITSVTESGRALTEDTDYYRHDSWLEKSSFALWPVDQQRPGGLQWSIQPYDVTVVGTFGKAAVPTHIKALCCALAASIGEYRKRTFQNEDGSSAEIPISSLPSWLGQALKNITRRRVGAVQGNRVTYT